MTRLPFNAIAYPQGVRDSWVGTNAWFHKSRASSFVKAIVRDKTQTRPNYFFGEAFAAAKIDHDDAWYASYKWLTAASWLQPELARDAPFQQRFRAALHFHFGAAALATMQQAGRELAASFGTRPSEPDLWLSTKSGHRMIEVKLQGQDDVDEGQLAGLAILACLPRLRITTEVVWLYPEGTAPNQGTWAKSQATFGKFCKALSVPTANTPLTDRNVRVHANVR